MQNNKETDSFASIESRGNKSLTVTRFSESLSGKRAIRSFVDEKASFFVSKRAFDITIALLVTLLILTWLIPLITILIKLESRGPVFFAQRRVGRGGRTFSCLKFRTMIVNEVAHHHQATVNDIRITKIGSFLRVTNLDEFPQFLNVLVGDMSIVGPRPHMHADCTRFASMVPGYKFRNLVKPGITGLAQVKGYRGPTTNFSSVFHRYQFDAFYVRNANFGLDLRIIRETANQTVVVILKKVTPRLRLNQNNRPFLQRKWVVALRSLIN